jgi:hypothetical protein
MARLNIWNPWNCACGLKLQFQFFILFKILAGIIRHAERNLIKIARLLSVAELPMQPLVSRVTEPSTVQLSPVLNL